MKIPSSTRMIAKARRAKGWTQQQLADAIGIHYVTMSKIETGKSNITVDLAIRLSESLGLSPWDLLMGGQHTRVLNLKGSVLDNSLVQPNETGKTIVMGATEDQLSGESHSWYELETEDFYPILQPGDLIRVTSYPDMDLKDWIERLCLVEDLDREGTHLVAIVSYGWLRKIHGTKIPVENFALRGAVTMSIMQGRTVLEVTDPEKI